MSNPFKYYVCDTETTGLEVSTIHSPIEISILRVEDDVQKTWFVKPINLDTIDTGALKINGHKLEDITHKTLEGKNKYIDAKKAIIEIENWLAEDMLATEDRILVGQNISFDKEALISMWSKCDCKDSFPFGRKIIDTRQFELLSDLAQGKYEESYSLNQLLKRYNLKNDKAHTAAADCLATKNLFMKQLEVLEGLFKK